MKNTKSQQINRKKCQGIEKKQMEILELKRIIAKIKTPWISSAEE